jgi:hypothetical protein
LQNGARTLGDVQFRRAVSTKPHQNSWRIDPKKWGNLAGHFQRFITLEALQRLDKKIFRYKFRHPCLLHGERIRVQKRTVFSWRPTLPSRRTARVSIQDTGDLAGVVIDCLRRKGQGDQETYYESLRLKRMMPWLLIRGQQYFYDDLITPVTRSVTRTVRRSPSDAWRGDPRAPRKTL